MKLLKISSLFVFLLLLSCGGDKAPQIGIPEIPVFETTTEEVTIFQDFVGTIAGQKDIAIRARVQGFLEGIHFKEGGVVKRGKLLYTIESQQYDAESAAMQSKVAEAKIMLAKAEADLNRTRPLAANNAVSQSELDADIAAYEAAQASVKAAEANLRAANIQLGYTKVKAPITGLIGRTRAKVGDYVGQSPNPVILNVVSLIDTVLVDFFLTEIQYLYINREARENESSLISENEPDSGKTKISLELILADGSFHVHKGKLNFIDRNIDPMTGAILIQASFPNSNDFLRPGQFAKIRISYKVKGGGILIPQRCVSELQGQYSVFVVDSENKIERREVKADNKVGDMWLIREGLVSGEKIVYEGLQKVRPGVQVKPVTIDNKQ